MLRVIVTSSSEARAYREAHSLASIEKAKTILEYQPTHNLAKGLQEAVEWYWENLK